MAFNEYSGTQLAVVTTEHTLATSTTAGNYVFKVDTKNMVLGDVLELRVYDKVLTGSTSGLAQLATYIHAQSKPNVVSIPFSIVFEGIISLKQTAGTGVNYDWALTDLS